MTCPKCNFQNLEGVFVCQNCKEPLHRRKINFWKIGFFIELGIIIPFSLIFIIGDILVKNNNIQMKVTEKETADNFPPENQVSNKEKITYPKIESWKTYTNPELGITFQYPSDWEIDDSYGSLWVKHMSENCEHLDPITCQYYGFYIGPESVNPPPSTENANLYILESTLEYEKGLDKCMRDTNTSCWGERAIPGLAYLGKEETLFSKQTIFPAAEIGTINRMQGSNYQYYIINNKRLYLVELAAPDFQAGTNNPSFTDENHPIIKIIKTLKFL